ncbi:prepilin-type N-terminal cleavage/methylation domain-containing protein [Candidatus Sumerlaeota bacterium]|nr:prepilin-type N-terminal cleavage/methylation domain-containing protein [Candidatus Sumerlaeota bacterium]
MSKKAPTAFTLIELLIVVAIIAILAAIAVPNFLEAQVRSKVARLRTDMRTIATALEAYFVDWNGYPMHIDFPEPPLPVNSRPPWFASLTTPVAYITSMPIDPFTGHYRNAYPPIFSYYLHYDLLWNTWGTDTTIPTIYRNSKADTWGPWTGFVRQMLGRGLWYILFSTGPDADTDISRRDGQKLGLGAFYDPTNGTVSKGDIVRFGPGASESITF